VAKASTQTPRMKASVKPSVKPNINWNTATPQQIEAYEDWLCQNSDDVKAKPKPEPKPEPKKPKQPKMYAEEQILQTIIPVAFRSPLRKAELNLKGYTINNEDIIPSVFPLKQQEKKFQLHHISPVGVWLVDLLQTAQWQYYVFINVNSRYLVVIPANAFILNGKVYVDQDVETQGIRSGTSYLQFAQALESPLSRGFNVTILKGDAQQSFNPFGRQS
jgi:hypothetical protein